MNRDIENIDVSAALFDANPPITDNDQDLISKAAQDGVGLWPITVPARVLAKYSPADMEIQGPFDDGSFLVGLRLVPRV